MKLFNQHLNDFLMWNVSSGISFFSILEQRIFCLEFGHLFIECGVLVDEFQCFLRHLLQLVGQTCVFYDGSFCSFCHLLIGDFSEVGDGLMHFLQHFFLELCLVLQYLFFNGMNGFLVFFFSFSQLIVEFLDLVWEFILFEMWVFLNFERDAMLMLYLFGLEIIQLGQFSLALRELQVFLFNF